MPIYTYRCKNCGVQFDIQQKFTDQTMTRCPECTKKTLYKVFQPVGIVFKGSGFYSTDHRSPSGANRGSGSSKSGEEKSESISESKSESKPDGGSSSKEKAETESAKSSKE